MAPEKRELSTDKLTYEFKLKHSDIIELMNDADVLLESGNVDTEQVMTIVHKKTNGTEVRLKEFSSGDTILFRYNKVVVTDDTTTFTDIDVT